MSEDIVARLRAAVPCGLRIRPGERCEEDNFCDQCELIDHAATVIDQLRGQLLAHDRLEARLRNHISSLERG